MNTTKLNNSSIAEELNALSAYTTLYHKMSDAVAICDYVTGNIIDSNNAALSLLNYSKEEITRLKHFDILPQFSSLFPNIDLHYFVKKEHVSKVLNGEEINVLGELITKDRNSIFAEFHIIPIKEKRGHAFIILKNVTEEVESQKKLISSEKRYKAIFNNASEAIMYFDLNTNKCIECNDVVKEMFGVPNKATFLNASIENFYSIDKNNELNNLAVNQVYRKILEEAKRDGSSCLVFELQKLNGEKFIAEITSVLKEDNEEYPRMISFVKDITKQYYAQKERDLLFNEMSQMMDSMPFQFAYKDLNNNIIKCNKAMKVTLNGDSENVEGRNLKEFLTEEEAKRFHSEDLRMINSGLSKLNTVSSIHNQEGKITWLKISKLPFLDLKGIPKGILTYVVDITDLMETKHEIKRKAEELNKKNKELKKYIESNSQLENFAAIASHDLQAPLRTIHSYTQLLQRSLKEKATDDQKDFMHFITSATSNMRHLIRDLRAFSKVDSTKLNIRTVNVEEMLGEVLRELQSSIEHQKAIISVTKNMPIIDGDRIKLRQLFQNLITNALKYIGKDVIPNIQISFENHNEFWCFKVKDNGIGIASEYQEKIFQLFQRLHNKDEYTGTGIGLSLCKKVVDQHLGILGVDSKVGQGSTFHFSIHKEVSKKLAELTE